MTTPTPRTDAVGRRAGKIMSMLASHDLRLTEAADEMQDNLCDMEKLETELTETRAALTTSTERLTLELREAKAERDALKALMKLPDDVCLSCGGDTGHEEGCRGTTGLMALSADLSRWRALAEELAGALEEANGGFMGSPQSQLRIDKALARYHAATNPAAVAAITPVIHRKTP